MNCNFNTFETLQIQFNQNLEDIKRQIKLFENNTLIKDVLYNQNYEIQSSCSSLILTILNEIVFKINSLRSLITNKTLINQTQITKESQSFCKDSNELYFEDLFLNQTQKIRNNINKQSNDESIFYSDSDQSSSDSSPLILEELKNLSPIRFEPNKNPATTFHKKIIAKPRGPYKKYTLEQKAFIIDKIKQNQPLSKLSSEYKIDAKTLKRWAEVGAARKPGGGRKVQDEEMEEKLISSLIHTMIKTKKKVPKLIIKKLAKEYSTISNFKASKGWYNNFLQRYNYENLEKNILEKQ